MFFPMHQPYCTETGRPTEKTKVFLVYLVIYTGKEVTSLNYKCKLIL